MSQPLGVFQDPSTGLVCLFKEGMLSFVYPATRADCIALEGHLSSGELCTCCGMQSWRNYENSPCDYEAQDYPTHPVWCKYGFKQCLFCICLCVCLSVCLSILSELPHIWKLHVYLKYGTSFKHTRADLTKPCLLGFLLTTCRKGNCNHRFVSCSSSILLHSTIVQLTLMYLIIRQSDTMR